LMDLEKARELVKTDAIFKCVSEHESDLLLPDQDVFNFLYGQHPIPIALGLCISIISANTTAKRHSQN